MGDDDKTSANTYTVNWNGCPTFAGVVAWSEAWKTDAGGRRIYYGPDALNEKTKIRTILDVLSAEETAEICHSIASLLEDDKNIPAAVKWLVYERLRQRCNTALLERQIEVLRNAVSFAPEELAEQADAECAELQKNFLRDAYMPKKDEV